MKTNILNRIVEPEALQQSGDFLGLTLTYPKELTPFSYMLNNGTVVEVWDTGVLCLTPANPAGIDLVLSSGVHGNETAPIELCAAICQDLLLEKIQSRHRLLFLFGNPPAMNSAKRELVDNLNRLFSGHHSKGEGEPNWERQRAAALEQYVLRFFNEGGANGAQHYCHADDAIHMERLETEHFLNAKPTDDFSLNENNSESYSYCKIFEIVPPLMFQVAFIYAHGV